MNFISICLHSLDMRDFHSNLRNTPFLDSLRDKCIFVPAARAQGHHQRDSLNAEMTGCWTARHCDSKLTREGFINSKRWWLPPTVLETLGQHGYERFTCLDFNPKHQIGSMAVQRGMKDYWLQDTPERLSQFSLPGPMSRGQWLTALKGSRRFYAHILLRETHRPWGDEGGLFGSLGWLYKLWFYYRQKRGLPCWWPYDAYIARRAALERPDELAALRRRALTRADAVIQEIFEATRHIDNVTYVVYSNHGEVLDHLRYHQNYATTTAKGLPMVEVTSHGPYPYEVLYASMQMWIIPGQPPRVMRGIGRLVDYAPTILDLAGVPAPPMDGESMLSWFEDGKFPGRERHAETPGIPGCLSMVREDSLKLMVRPSLPDGHELAVFDLASDPLEQIDLIGTPLGRDLLAWAVARHAEIKRPL